MSSPTPELESATRELNNIRHAVDRAAIVAITDRAGLITHVNDKFCEISRYSREELLGQNHRIINSGFHPHEFFAEMWKTISAGQVWEGEIQNRAKDGSLYWVNTTIIPFLGPTGRPDQYVSIRFEITQRKRAEEQLRIYAQAVKRDNARLRKEVQRTWSLGNIIGKSPGMKNVFDLVARVSQVTANILITGESGTGKEVIARAIHESGPRASKPFIAINCTAIPDTLLESELFGHARGSFTGALQNRRGLFEEAEGGTLFLDEIGDMNVQLQAKILRVIQERKIRPVGDNTDRPIDVRIIAATHKDLPVAMREGLFREDLYYRLSVIPIHIPPLRDRIEDIPLLAEYFREKYAAANHVPVTGFTQDAMAKLCGLHWDGNVRELENFVERAVVLCNGPLIDASSVPSVVPADTDRLISDTVKDLPSLLQLEERYMRLVLQKTGGKKDKASQILGINRRTLYRKEREYGFFTTPESGSDNLDL